MQQCPVTYRCDYNHAIYPKNTLPTRFSEDYTVYVLYQIVGLFLIRLNENNIISLSRL